MEMPSTFHEHPYAWGGAVGVVALYLLLKRSSGASTASSGTAVVSTAIDPTAAALSASQAANNTQLTLASIAAQTQTAGLTAAQNINSQNDSAAVQVAGYNADVANAQTMASVFGTAVAGLTANNNTAEPDSGGVGYVTSTQANGYVEQNNANWQPWMNNDIGGTVPIMSGTAATPNATNATNNMIEEMYNNLGRVGQGTSPLQTVTMQDGSGGLTQTGVATIDPVFAVWDGSSAVPSITDVTLNSASQYGYTGSVYTPGDASAVNITPNAVPAAQTAQLPRFVMPTFGNAA